MNDEKSEKENCLFCKIAAGEMNTEMLYSGDQAVAFNDVNPQADVHVLVVPKKHYRDMNEAPKEIAAECFSVVKKMALEKDIEKTGYRVVINCGSDGGQEVGHLHFHLLGGRKMQWPPG